MNQMQILAMDRAGETGEVIFRTPCSVGSGEVAKKRCALCDEPARVGVICDACHDSMGTKPLPAAIAAATEGAGS